MPAPDRSHAMDHIVVVLFENRSLDNVLGRLYGPSGRQDLRGRDRQGPQQPGSHWAEHGADRKAVPYTVATDMDSPNPDSGEEYFHTNTQLFNTLDDHNRFKIGEAVSEPVECAVAGATPTMDGFVTDYISTFTGEIGRQPTYDEYAHIMTGYTPEQLPVLSGIARDFGVFDHWFCEVPSQTFMNRSFWTAATSSGLVVNSPMPGKWLKPTTTPRRSSNGSKPTAGPGRSTHGADAAVVHGLITTGVGTNEYRHTLLIATLRKAWGLGEPFTQRDASARTFDHLFTRATPADPRRGQP